MGLQSYINKKTGALWISIQHYVETIYIVYYKRNESNTGERIPKIPYAVIPKIYGLMDSSGADASGIIKTRNDPVLNLYGNNVLIAIIDTGIDYTNPLFINQDGSTRIISIWDQSIEGPMDTSIGIKYGTEYVAEEINLALAAEDSYAIIPSRDDNGHGTFIAGIAAGGIDEVNDFTGVAPNADIIVVKLKEAKQYLRDLYLICDDEPAYQENDIINAISYVNSVATSLRKSLSICIGLGSNSGGHNGLGILEKYLNRIGNATARSVSVPTGNEGNARHHFNGRVVANTTYDIVEINVGENEKGFVLELWGTAPNVYAVGFESPRGAVIDRVPPRFDNVDTIDFVLEDTVIDVYYRLVEAQSGDEVIVIRIEDPKPGIWKIRVYATGSVSMEYNIWLPIKNFISDNTYFVQSNPNTTIVSPGNSSGVITSAGYNHYNGSFFVESGRGYTSNNDIKPDLAAPAVEIYGPGLRKNYVRRSGTSISAAYMAGG